jgi:hypothetical protein
VGDRAPLEHDVVDRALREAAAHRQTGVAAADHDDGGGARVTGAACRRRGAGVEVIATQLTSTTTFVGLVTMS